jgi:hypothetical protein
VRAVSLALPEVSIDGNSATGWQLIGFNLDGKCTIASSTDACTLAAGAPRSAQDDGTGGIDNSYGENICPIFETFAGAGACSTALAGAYLVTDSSGKGTLALPMSGSWLELPIADTWVSLSGGTGAAGGVVDTAGLIAAFHAVAGSLDGHVEEEALRAEGRLATASSCLPSGIVRRHAAAEAPVRGLR